MRFNNAAKHLSDDSDHRTEESSGEHKKFLKATKEILDNAPVMVYEELSADAFNANGQPLFEISQCQFEGGLSKSRVKWIKAVHVIHPSHAQLVQARALHQTCHYSVPQEQLDEFHQHAASHNLRVVHYVRHKSYCGDSHGFIKVWNHGTEEFDSIEALFTELRFDRTAKARSESYKEEDNRGNSQASFGVSTQNIKVRNNLGTAVPQFNKGTADNVDSMLILSKLSQTINGTTDSSSLEQERNPAQVPLEGFYHQFVQADQSEFAKAIHPECVFEGMTDGGYDHWARLYAHVDKHNCHLEHRDRVLIASRVVLEMTSNKTWAPRRLIQIGYMRKAVTDFALRHNKLGSVVALAKDFYFNELPESRRQINRNFALDGWDEMIEGGIFGRACNMNKCAYYSPIADALRSFMDTFNPSDEDLADICQVIPPLSESTIFPRVMRQWIERAPHLPKGSLCQAFAKDALKFFGGFASGPGPRKQTCLGKRPLPCDCVDQSRKTLFDFFQWAKTQDPCLDSVTKVRGVYSDMVRRLCRPVQKGGLFYTKEIGAQHLIAVLVLVRKIHQAELVSYAKISTGTNTAKRLTSKYGIQPSEFLTLLSAVAHALNVDLMVAENVLCEMLRWPLQKTDLFLPGQLMYSYKRQGSKVVVVRFNPLNPNRPEETVPLYQPPSSSESSTWRPFSHPERPIKATGQKRDCQYRTVFFRCLDESVEFLRQASKHSLTVESLSNFFEKIYQKHPLASPSRSDKRKICKFRASSIQFPPGKSDWLDLCCRVYPLAVFLNEKRLKETGLWKEDVMRPWTTLDSAPHRRQVFTTRTSALEVDSLLFTPDPVVLSEEQQMRVEACRKRIRAAVSRRGGQQCSGIFSRSDPLTGHQLSSSEDLIRLDEVIGWQFDPTVPTSTVRQSLCNGSPFTPTPFGSKVYKDISATNGKPDSGNTTRKKRRLNKEFVPDVSLDRNLVFSKRLLGEIVWKRFMRQVVWSNRPLVARSESEDDSRYTLLHCENVDNLDVMKGSVSSQATDGQPHRIQLRNIVHSIIGFDFRVGYIETHVPQCGRAYTAYIQPISKDDKKQRKPVTNDGQRTPGHVHKSEWDRLSLGSLDPLSPGCKSTYAHPHGHVYRASRGTCGAPTSRDYYGTKNDALVALFIHLLIYYGRRTKDEQDQARRCTVIRNHIFCRLKKRRSILADFHTGHRSKHHICSAMFHVVGNCVYILLPNGGGEDTLAQPCLTVLQL